MKVYPLNDWMVIQLVEKNKSAIVLPESYDKTKDDAAIFEVISVGEGYYENGVFIPAPVRAGQHVIISAYGMGKIKIDDNVIYMARARDVALVVEEDREEVKKDAGV